MALDETRSRSAVRPGGTPRLRLRKSRSSRSDYRGLCIALRSLAFAPLLSWSCPDSDPSSASPPTQCGESVGRNCAANRVVLWHFRHLPLLRQYKYGHGKLLLKVLRRKSFLMFKLRGTECGIPATGTQEGDDGLAGNHGF